MGVYAYLLFRKDAFKWEFLFSIGLLFRLSFLFSFPALSDDVYRFIWDGILLNNSADPFAMLPSEMSELSDFQEFLLAKMNSPNYYSVYPPGLQYIFGLTAWIGSDSLLANVLVFRSLIIMAEVAAFFLLRNILKRLKLSAHRAFIYFLNPLVIIELSGNLHPEAFWICLFLLAVYLMMKQKWALSGAAFASSIMIKLIPLLFAPILIRKLRLNAFFSFAISAILLSLSLGIIIVDLNTILNLGDSIDLYFRNFEFNASIYYLLSWVGFQFYGYNPIQSLGPLLAILTALMVLFIQLRKSSIDWHSMLKRTLLSLAIYYLLALVVHPWYLAPLIALSCFRSYLFPLIWSMLIFLSYHRYALGVEQESVTYLCLEYLPLYLILLWEMKQGETASFLRLKQKVFNFTG